MPEMSGAEEKTEFREIPPDLQAVLEAHRRWVASEGREGAKANLRKADLSRLDLQGAQLRGADLSEANLIQVRFSGADPVTSG
ncbi:MAG: hypothetical protein EXS64_20830 [Candidatus Latescibacteria bacterium]|nr:hypothetical protein [Candidatus Latescibacterota bacterium]